MQIFAQILGFIGVGINLLIYQQKTQNRVLFFKFLSDILWSVHYFCLGAFSGAAIACIGIFREGIFMLCKRNREKWLILFMLLAIGSAFLTWKNIFSLFPATASILSVLSFWQKSAKNTRLLAFPISICMGIYSFACGSWSGVFNELLTIGSAAIGLIRKDIKNNEKE